MTREQLRRITEVRTLALLPELRARSMPAEYCFEQFRTRIADVVGIAVPYWAVAWPGGQALARYLLDRPETVAGRHVIDIGCGCGLIATAAMKAGASSAEAVDADANALLAAAETAEMNKVMIDTRQSRLQTLSAAPGTVICAGDLWYERQTGRGATVALNRLAENGAIVLCGDPGRPGRPRKDTVELAQYEVQVSMQFESAPKVMVHVFAIETGAIRQAHYPYAQNEGRRQDGFEVKLRHQPEGGVPKRRCDLG